MLATYLMNFNFWKINMDYRYCLIIVILNFKLLHLDQILINIIIFPFPTTATVMIAKMKHQ